MKKRRRLAGLALVLSTAAILQGCGATSSNASSSITSGTMQMSQAGSPGGLESTSGGSSSSYSSSSSGSAQAATCNASPPAASSFWIPVQESPVSGASGNNGVYVLRSDALSCTPSAIAPSTPNAALLATAGSPAADPASNPVQSVAMYYATGPDNNVHIYGINLADTSSIPTARQIGSLSLNPASNGQICRAGAAQWDKSDPQTLFVILQIGATPVIGACGAGGTFELVNFTDSASAAPTPLPYWYPDVLPPAGHGPERGI